MTPSKALIHVYYLLTSVISVIYLQRAELKNRLFGAGHDPYLFPGHGLNILLSMAFVLINLFAQTNVTMLEWSYENFCQFYRLRCHD